MKSFFFAGTIKLPRLEKKLNQANVEIEIENLTDLEICAAMNEAQQEAKNVLQSLNVTLYDGLSFRIQTDVVEDLQMDPADYVSDGFSEEECDELHDYYSEEATHPELQSDSLMGLDPFSEIVESEESAEISQPEASGLNVDFEDFNIVKKYCPSLAEPLGEEIEGNCVDL